MRSGYSEFKEGAFCYDYIFSKMSHSKCKYTRKLKNSIIGLTEIVYWQYTANDT